MNLYAIVERMARERPDATFLAEGERALSYAEVDRRVGRAAACLASLGVGRGDRVATVMRNSVELLETMYAAARIGAIWAPLNWRLAEAEWEYILGDAEPVVAIADADLAERVAPVAGGARTLPLDGPGSWAEAVAACAEPAPPPAPVANDDPARIMYTSGTTAHPKGAVISHANVLFKNAAYERDFALRPDDVALLMGPLFHVGGLDAPGVALANRGGQLVVLPAFDAAAALDHVERFGVTVLWSAPTMTEMLLAELGDDPGGRTDSVRTVITGSSQSSSDLLERALDAFPRAAIVDGYGMTESVSGSIFIDVRSDRAKLGSVGSIDRPTMYERLRVVGEDGSEAGPGEPGEIQVSGAKLFRGYWRDEAANAAAFTEDGWFRTGDVGELDQDRYLYIVDRKKDMIKSGGENIGSLEIERVVLEIDGVTAASAVAVPHPKWGETPAVFVEGDLNRLDEEDVRRHCAERLARFKVPRYVFFVPEVPRTSSGKARKAELRARAAELAAEREVRA